MSYQRGLAANVPTPARCERNMRETAFHRALISLPPYVLTIVLMQPS